MRTRALPAALGLVLAVGGVGMSAASAQPTLTAGSCGPAHRYIDAQVGAFGPKNVVIVDGRTATLKCGGDDDSSYVPGAKISLTMAHSATVTVWKVPENPDAGTRTLPASALPKWIKRNSSEPIYKITGPNGAVTKLVEEWHP